MDEQELCCEEPDYKYVDSHVQGDGFGNEFDVMNYECKNCGSRRQKESRLQTPNNNRPTDK